MVLANLVNGLSALASGSNIFSTRKKEDTLSGKLSDGRVNFEDALSYIYPDASPRAQAPQSSQFQSDVTVESVTIYEAYRGLSTRSYSNLPDALASLNQGHISSQETAQDTMKNSEPEQYQSLIDTYDNLPVQSYEEAHAQQRALAQLETAFETTNDVYSGGYPTTNDAHSYSYETSASNAISPDTFENITRVQAELAQQILGNYAETVAPVRREFLDNLTNASHEFLSARSSLNRPAPAALEPTSLTTSMTALIDRIFNTLEPYIHELNQTFRTTDLSVTFTPPAVVNENVGYDTLRRPAVVVSSYRCRISTTRLALVIRGKEDRVDFFLLPVETVMGLSRIEDEHSPLMTFTAEARNGVISWEVEEKPLTEERLEKYILLIFEHLMDLTREQLLQRPASVVAV